MADPMEHHGPGVVVAHNDVGSVNRCGCGVLTLTLQCLSVRLAPAAFRELAQLVMAAQHRLDDGSSATANGEPTTGTAMH